MHRLQKKSSYQLGDTSAAKVAVDFARLTARLKPRPFKTKTRTEFFRYLRCRCRILTCALSLLFWALPAVAQVEYDGFTVGMGGTIGAGYNGDLAGQAGSDHGLSLNGTGSLEGSFYNPNFISFSAQPYYNRSQANSGSGSIFDSSGYTGNINIFTGSHFPGNISFGQAFDSTGLYGIPGESGLTTKNSNRNFGIGWSALLPDLPSLTVSYARGSGTSSLLGSDAQSDSTTNSFTVRSGYRLAGLNLGTSFVHQTVDSNSAGILGSDETQTSDTSSNTFQINASRGFPRGGFGIGYSRSEYSNAYSAGIGGSSSGTTDNLFGNVGFQLWKLPLSASVAYTDNLYGSFEEQLLSNGQTYVQANISPESRSLLMNLSTSHSILPHVFATVFVSRQEEYLAGSSFGSEFGRTSHRRAPVPARLPGHGTGADGVEFAARLHHEHDERASMTQP